MAKQEEILNKIEKSVVKAKGRFAPADLVAETGYPIDDVNSALKRLLEIYTAKVSMNQESGSLEFKFDYPLQKHGSKTLKEQLESVAEAFWKVFKVIYKASIAVVLILYTVIFLLLILALMFSGKGDNDRDNGGMHLVGGIFRAIFQGLYFYHVGKSFQYASDPHGLRYKQFEPEKNKGKKFIQGVFHFVFGPERPEFDPLENDKEVIAFLRRNSFKLTSANIIELSGATYEEADHRLAEYIAKYDGEPHIDTDGVLTVAFPRLQERVSEELQGGRIELYADEVEPPYELNGNSGGQNTIIIIMNIFNLIMSLAGINIGLSDFESAFAAIALGYFPLVFSVLFFAIPIVRSFKIKQLQKQRERNIIHKKVVNVIIKAQPAELTEQQILEYAQVTPQEIELAKDVIKDTVIELQGELNLNSRSEAVYSFPRLKDELAASK